MTGLVLTLVVLFILLQALRRPARTVPRPTPRALSARDVTVPVRPMPAGPEFDEDPFQQVLASPPATDWRAQFDRTPHGPGLCSPK